MATVSNLVSVSGTAVADYQDTVQHLYRVEYDAPQGNFTNALIAAQTASGNPVPVRRAQLLGTAFLFASAIHGEAVNASREVWEWTVTFTQPPIGEFTIYQFDNPLERPAVPNIEYMDIEVPIWEARNVQDLPRGDGNGGNRAAGTLGPIVNAAGIQPDVPLMQTRRLEVLVIKRNYAALADITTVNRTYKETTNADVVQGYQKRELRYLLTESLGLHFENGVEFWPGVTTILAEDSTDLTLDNVGLHHWELNALKRFKDADNNDTVEPRNLKVDGTAGGDHTTTISYQLEEIDYAPLF